MHYNKLWCPVSDCNDTFDSEADLQAHLAINNHHMTSNESQTANDIARYHLMERSRTTSIRSLEENKTILRLQTATHTGSNESINYERFSSPGWGIKPPTRTPQMNVQVKNFVDNVWNNSIQTGSRLNFEQIQQQIRTSRDVDGNKMFKPDEYPTLNQIKNRCRKSSK
jgi:hypothetical protein